MGITSTVANSVENKFLNFSKYYGHVVKERTKASRESTKWKTCINRLTANRELKAGHLRGCERSDISISTVVVTGSHYDVQSRTRSCVTVYKCSNITYYYVPSPVPVLTPYQRFAIFLSTSREKYKIDRCYFSAIRKHVTCL